MAEPHHPHVPVLPGKGLLFGGMREGSVIKSEQNVFLCVRGDGRCLLKVKLKQAVCADESRIAGAQQRRPTSGKPGGEPTFRLRRKGTAENDYGS
jgi:hypothetical protein